MNRNYFIRLFPFLFFFGAGLINAQQYHLPQQQDRWAIQPDGSIEWKIDKRVPHYDHVEMAGQKVALWVQYGVDSAAKPVITRTIVFPTFRLLPNKTSSAMMYNVSDAELPGILINDRLFKAGVYNGTPSADMPERVTHIRQKGILEVYSEIGKERTLHLKRIIFPSTDKALALEKWVFTNTGKDAVKLEMEFLQKEIRPSVEKVSEGPHSFFISTINDGLKTLAAGASVAFGIIYQATHGTQPIAVSLEKEEQARKDRVNNIQSLLVLETPDTILNTAFAFAKIRATESIYNTKGGYMHGPGGLRYYAAIWANDQAEYVNPFFAFLGDELGNKSAMNAYRMFARYMNPEYKPIPSSIIAEGDGVWQGAKDRGDMAMIAYGASRYALTYGNKDSAKVLWPLIEWCLEYLKRKINNEGVVASNSDELEGRFPAGSANLNTSSLYYDALVSAQYLGKLLGLPVSQIKDYEQRANLMHANIEKYFGANVEGFNTYRYYKGNDTLRAWITTPLVVNIHERKSGTVDALFSPRLWTEDGLASLAGNKTFWDRSTLYAMRGVLNAGETERVMPFLKYYSQRRLLGEHVPYPVEAYPEGNQRHLSAESGLYARIYTEGLFGIRPVGFNSFDCTPRLPKDWNKMSLKNIHSFGTVFDLSVTREANNKLSIEIKKGSRQKQYLINDGETRKIEL